jgi:EmrB/QacA subfamily drug resistance transporter
MPSQTNPHFARRWSILAILGIAQLMVVLDMTVVNIALPSAQHALHFANDQRQWVITAYALSFGSLLLLGGRISDMFGRKWTFIGGLLGFAIASAAGGAAQSFDMLVAARAVQGAFAAILAPAALSLLTTTFTERGERAKAFGIYGAIAGAGASVGLLLGGVLTSELSWRFTMFINLLFAISAAVGALALLHNERPAKRPRIDVPGTLTVSSGLFAVVFGLNHAQTTSWGNVTTIAFLAVGALLLSVFVAIEARVGQPLLPLRVPADRNRGAAFLSAGIASAAMFGVFLFLTYYLQQNLHYTPIRNGFAFLPLTAMVMAAAMIAQTRLVPRFGPKPLVAGGMALAGLGMLLLAQLGVHSTYLADVLPATLLIGVGYGLVVAPAMSAATLGVRPNDSGVASATLTASQQIGGSVGTALLSTIAASAASGQLAGVRPTATLITSAAVHGYTTAFTLSGGLFAAGAVIAMCLFRSGPPVFDIDALPALAH